MLNNIFIQIVFNRNVFLKVFLEESFMKYFSKKHFKWFFNIISDL